MTHSALLFVAVTAFAAGAPGEEPPPPSIGVMELVPVSPGDTAVAKLASSALVESLARRGKGKVLGSAELKGMLAASAQAQLLGCQDDERCFIDAAKAVATDRIVIGRIGRAGPDVLAFLSLVDTKAAAVLARASGKIGIGADALKKSMDETASALAPGASLSQRMETLALALLDPKNAKSGDQRLGELRVAVLFDELDESGKPVASRPVEACAQKALLDAGADLVSASVVAKLKGKAAARDVLAGRVPDTLGTDEIDVILAGVAEARPAGEYMSAKKMEVQLTTQLVKIDTGDTLDAETLVGQGVEHAVAVATRKATEKVCAKVLPALQAALDRRLARGERVVLEVAGKLTPDDGQLLVDRLEKLKRVGRARVKKISADKAVVDVVLAGGDGVALALDLAPLGLAVTDASTSLVRTTRAAGE